MKKYLLILVTFFIGYIADGQSFKPCIPCLPDGICFTTQSQIDSFPINYPGCTVIQGDVEIGGIWPGSDITNLNGLSGLTAISGDCELLYNNLLNSLSGLNLITEVGENLRIQVTQSLKNLSGLETLSIIGGDLTISYNSSLMNFSGLDSLSFVGGDLIVDANDSLIDLTGLESLTSLTGDLLIFSNSGLTSLNGLNNLISINGHLTIDDNHSLTSLTALEKFNNIGGFITIQENLALTNLNGLNHLKNIPFYLYLFQNNSLNSLAALDSLTTIGSSLFILDNDSLSNLDGLENLVSVGGLSIWDNFSLFSLSGLINLSKVGDEGFFDGEIGISSNPSLSSLYGLDNIGAWSINELAILNNGSLSTCEVKSICDYLATPNTSVEIHDNAPGCNSIVDVDSACAYLSIGDSHVPKGFSLYPNPSSTLITIETESQGTISIHTTCGQLILQQQISDALTIIDITGLKGGIYFVRVTGNNSVQTGKFFKQ
jgi:hypothetical protein